jgi:hypothetical protein
MPGITEQLKTALADRYVIEQELGAGGMATVYLAHDVKHNRKVALKVLRPELAAVIGAERFLKEIEVTANLQHPHILPLHDSGEADTFLYYVIRDTGPGVASLPARQPTVASAGRTSGIRGADAPRRRLVMKAMTSLLVLSCIGAAAAAAQEKPIDRQIADAVSPLPDTLRPDARVLGYRDGQLEVLRSGSNAMVCLADDPAREGFHVACYHESLEPFMARGRELRAQGVERPQLDSIRLAEIESGSLPMPPGPTALYSLSHDGDAFDPAGEVSDGVRGLYVIYLPYATEASTGISTVPAADRPWLMFPGKPWAHVMINR